MSANPNPPPKTEPTPFKPPRTPPLQNFLTVVAGEIDRTDFFGQNLTQLYYRYRRVEANGLFGRVRDLCDAVTAAGGSVAEARTWLQQALRWHNNGKAVDQSFAKFEFDPACARAMDGLLRFLLALPDDLMRRASLSGLFGNKPSDPKMPTPGPTPFAPAPQPPRSPFGSRPNTPPTSPFGKPQPPAAKPPVPPAPPPKPSGLFGQRPASPFGQSDMPPFLTTYFTILSVQPDVGPAADPVADVLLELQELAESYQTEKAPETWPTDLQGLIERFIASNDSEVKQEALSRIGLLNDPRALDYLYNQAHSMEDTDSLLDTFKGLYADIGVMGLMTLLPVDSGKRFAWLHTLTELVRETKTRAHPLSPESQALIWQVAQAESDPELVFCPAALHLLAAIGTPAALAILWRYAYSDELDERRAAVYAMLTLDPGPRLKELVSIYGDLPPLPSNPFNQKALMKIHVPFERLEGLVSHSQPKIAVTALHLAALIDHPRRVPMLIRQLARPVLELRIAAFAELTRLEAKEAADAVARLMISDPELNRRAAELLADWGDARCVPMLISIRPNVLELEDGNLISKLDKLNHPDYEAWIVQGLETILARKDDNQVSTLLATIQQALELKSPCLQRLLARLVDYPDKRVRLAVARALPTLNNEWATAALKKLSQDAAPAVAYCAVSKLADADFGRELLSNRSELSRVLGVYVLFNAKAVGTLIDCLQMSSQPVRDLAITILGELHAQEAVDALRQIVQTEDRIDPWGQNPAALAWRSLARMDALGPLKPAVLSQAANPQVSV